MGGIPKDGELSVLCPSLPIDNSSQGKPHLSYMVNMRGYESDRRRYIDIHLRTRKGCRETDPVVRADAMPKGSLDHLTWHVQLFRRCESSAVQDLL
eukprot:1185178-Prorocentrum_minimum.AAC.3